MTDYFRIVANFIVALYTVYVDLFFTYLEINPLGKAFLFM